MKFTPPQVFGNKPEQDEHDQVVRLIAAEQSSFGTHREAFYNVNNKQDNPLTFNGRDYYPDVIVCPVLKRDQPIAIFEVKTANDFRQRTIDQLLNYAGFGLEFHVYVPHSSLEKFVNLCQRHNIACVVGTFRQVRKWFGWQWKLEYAVRDLRRLP
jgi:hypothetical protein